MYLQHARQLLACEAGQCLEPLCEMLPLVLNIVGRWWAQSARLSRPSHTQHTQGGRGRLPSMRLACARAHLCQCCITLQDARGPQRNALSGAPAVAAIVEGPVLHTFALWEVHAGHQVQADLGITQRQEQDQARNDPTLAYSIITSRAGQA